MSPVRVHPAPVLVVGTGPVGLFQAHALATLGGECNTSTARHQWLDNCPSTNPFVTVVPVIIVGRHLSRLGAPKAHALSPRSLEICRQFDISVAEIRQHPAPRHEARWVRFVTNLSGQEVGCLPYERMSLDVLDASPEVSGV
jgi:2-polyprenyl-6-methoxyphenol hydroxylase-like FAD-dependent oxidoreductase